MAYDNHRSDYINIRDIVTKPTFTAIEHICMNLRERDAEEIYNLKEYENPFRLAYECHHLIMNQGRGAVSWVRGRPVALAAFIQHHPGTWEVWMFGTDEFLEGLKGLMRWIRTEANDILESQTVLRLQCDSRADYKDAHNLIRSMGGKEEARFRRFGKDGSDYLRFVWIVGENDQFLRPNYVRVDRK